MEPHPVRREDPHLRHEHASGAQRREPGERRGGQDVAREALRIRAEGPGRGPAHARPLVERIHPK